MQGESSALAPATAAESIAGHPLTQLTLTGVAALAGGPLAALLPVLGQSLAAERHRCRIEIALATVSASLLEQEAAIRDLTDAQFKLVNEGILALLHTTSDAKIDYLRRAIVNSVTMKDVLPQEAVVLSRVIRDISAEEADFLFKNFHRDRVQLSSSAEGTGGVGEGPLKVDPDSREALVASGLVSLGLLVGAESTWDSSNPMSFSSIVAKLLALLGQPKSAHHATQA